MARNCQLDKEMGKLEKRINFLLCLSGNGKNVQGHMDQGRDLVYVGEGSRVGLKRQ